MKCEDPGFIFPLLLAVILVLCLVDDARGEEPESVADLITRLDRYPAATERANGPGWQQRFADAFEVSAREHNVSASLLAVMARFESDYLPGQRGDQGRSWGLLQVGERGRKICECDVTGGVDEEIRCGACWLRAGIDWCGTVRGGVTAYACGHCSSSRRWVQAAVDRRLRLAGEME